MSEPHMGAMPGDELVRLVAIEKSYGTIRSLRGAHLELRRGEVLGLVGDNAAGKSTLMKVLSGAVVPDRGQILLQGREVRFGSPKDARRQRIEMVYQDLALCDTIDVAGNLFLGREPRRSGSRGLLLDRLRMHQQARQMLASLGISMPSTRQRVRNLSGGQRQAVAIARAVAFDPHVLIMDEPTAALAVREVESVLALIRRVSEQGVGVILITHRLQDLFEVCDRVMVLYEGETVANVPIAQTDLAGIVAYITGQHLPTRRAGRHATQEEPV